MSKRLVILTDNFGLNFSGGATATCRIVEQLKPHFSKLTVVGKQVGDHPFQELEFLPYKHPLKAIRILRQLNSEQTIFYGDFYMAYYFILAGVHYYFTYHDNWPEQARLGWKNRLSGLFYIPLYRWIICRAKTVVTVSEFKYKFVQAVNPKAKLIRNGINASQTKQSIKPIRAGEKLRILMLGNIDDRKFGWSQRLFKAIMRAGADSCYEIDIFGHHKDKVLANQLKSFSFVNLQGFIHKVDFSDYHLYLSTSKMENLSIAVCEALLNYTPVLSFDVGGLSEVIQHRKNGILVEAGNVEDLYKYLQEIYERKINFDFSDQDLSMYNWKKAARLYAKVFGIGSRL